MTRAVTTSPAVELARAIELRAAIRREMAYALDGGDNARAEWADARLHKLARDIRAMARETVAPRGRA